MVWKRCYKRTDFHPNYLRTCLSRRKRTIDLCIFPIPRIEILPLCNISLRPNRPDNFLVCRKQTTNLKHKQTSFNFPAGKQEEGKSSYDHRPMQCPDKQWNWFGPQLGQPVSSEPSEQSAWPSHLQSMGMQSLPPVFFIPRQVKWSAPQDGKSEQVLRNK